MCQLVRGSLFVALTALVSGACACSVDPCFPDSKGKEYRVKIIEEWNSDSSYTGGWTKPNECPQDLDLVAGGSFDVKIKGFKGGSPDCECGKGEITGSPDSWKWVLTGPERGCLSNFLTMTVAATQGDCDSIVFLDIHASGIPTGHGVPGKAPAATVDRVFQGGLNCPNDGQHCYNSLVAEIEEL